MIKIVAQSMQYNSSRGALRFIVLLSIFLTPAIDMANGIIGEESMVGSLIRGIILIENVFIVFFFNIKNCSRICQKESLICLSCIIYLVFLFCIQVIYHNGVSIPTDLSYFLKVLLYITEVVCLVTCIQEGVLGRKDFEAFWKYSLWLIPISLIFADITNSAINTAAGNKGYFMSVNALTAVLLVQVILSLYFVLKRKLSIVALLLNLVTILLIGTKTPYIFILLALVVLLLFDSKNRKKLLIAILFGVVVIILLISTIFKEQFNSVFQWQQYFIGNIDEDNSILNYLLSGRDELFIAAWQSFQGIMKVPAMLFGVGPYSLFASIGSYSSQGNMRGLEMDVFEIMFSCGIFIVVVVYRYFVKALRCKSGDRVTELYLNLAIILIGIYSILGGHVITEAFAGTYCAILFGYKFSFAKEWREQKINMVNGRK